MTTISEPAARPTGKRSAGPRRTGGRLRQSYDRYWYAYAMVAPVVAVLVVLVGYPLVRGLYLSLTDVTEQNVGRTIGVNHIPASYKFVGLHNYINILSGKEGTFYPRLTWTLEWTIGCEVPTFLIGMGLAVLLNRGIRGQGLYRAALIVPWAVPGFVSCFGWRLIFNKDNGVLNAALKAVGFGGTDWLAHPGTAKFAVIMVNVWLGVPFVMVALLGGLQSIPKELHEAAEVDGASPWQRFRAVTLPGLRPVSNTVILLGIIWTFNQFTVIFLVTEGGPAGATDILVTQSYLVGFAGVRDYANAAAYGTVILSMLLVFAIFYRRFLDRQTQGALR